MLQFSRWKQAAILLTCLLGFLLVLPNFLSQRTLSHWPGWLPGKPLTLGLDLQGGAHLLYALEVDDVRKGWLEGLRESARQRLREAKIAVASVDVSGNAVAVRLTGPQDADAAFKALRQIVQPLGNPLLGQSGNDVEVTRGEGGMLAIAPTEAGLRERTINAVSAAIETVRRRVDPSGTAESSIVRQGADRILIQVPGLQDTAALKERIGETAVLTFHEVHPTLSAKQAKAGRIPPGYKIYPATDRGGAGGEGGLLLREAPVVRGDDLTSARPGFEPRSGAPVVDFTFNPAGARQFAKFTRAHVGEPFAVVLDGKVISAPVIQTAIEGGRGYIEGHFTVATATKLAIQLESGALPAKLTIVNEGTVGPSLGSDSIAAGKVAGIVGAIATIVLTVLTYGTFGLFACVGLIVHGVLTVAAMTLMGSALTLPGIAGLVLGIAMAVDANVLIYERIREEVRAGKTAVAAIDAGFTRAFVTIADSQLTTLACALVMFWLGSGPIRGFAVTLTIGICTSIFASVTVVRLLVAWWLASMRGRTRGAPLTLPV
jgi:preprotein translocase subunit SecD